MISLNIFKSVVKHEPQLRTVEAGATVYFITPNGRYYQGVVDYVTKYASDTREWAAVNYKFLDDMTGTVILPINELGLVVS